MSVLNLPQYLTLKVEQFGERIFLRDFGSRNHYTYQDLANVTDQSGGRAAGAGHPNRRARRACCIPITPILSWDISPSSRPGAVAVPINPVYTAKEILYILEDCGAGCLITTSDFEPLLGDPGRKGRPSERNYHQR